jgi:tetratricopeptide (TPR) repeat protein
MGETENAVTAFNESLRIDGGQYAVLCNLGVALSAEKDFDGAEHAFREAALLKPDDPRPLAYTGVAYVQNQKWNDAARNLRRALSRSPNDPQLQTALALAELHTQGAQAALKRLQAVASANPDYEPALFNLGAIYSFWLQSPQQAGVWFERYLEHSNGVDAFSAAARARLQALKEPAKKSGLPYTPTTERSRSRAEQFFQQALNSHRAGKTPEAITGYIKAIEADDSYDRAFYNLGLAYYATGQMALAREAFGQAVNLNPAFVDARYNAALVDHYHLGKTPQAINELNVVLTQQPNYQPAKDLLARIRK